MIWQPYKRRAQVSTSPIDCNRAQHTYRKVGKPVKHLRRVLLGSVVHVPVVHGGVGNQTQRLFTEPFPVDDILVHHCGLELLLCLKVEDLNCAPLSLEGDDVLGPVHDGTVGIDRPPHNLIVVL